MTYKYGLRNSRLFHANNKTTEKIGHNPLPALEKETGREGREERMLPSGGNQVRPDTAG